MDRNNEANQPHKPDGTYYLLIVELNVISLHSGHVVRHTYC